MGVDERPTPWGGVKKPWASVSSTQEGSSSSSAFPPLSRQSGSPARGSTSQWRPYSSTSSSSFNPYPTRNQELADRAHHHAHRRREYLNRRDPDVTTLRSYERSEDDDDDAAHPATDFAEQMRMQRGATMSSIIFRDQSASATSRSASSANGTMSPGLALFAQNTFGGEPLRLISYMDNEARGAHMGPRIYKRHNAKYVQAKRRGKGVHIPTPVPSDGGQPAALLAHASTSARSISDEADLMDLVQQYRQLSEIVASSRFSKAQTDRDDLGERLCLKIEHRVAEPLAWCESEPPVTQDLGFATGSSCLSADIPELQGSIRRSTLKGMSSLLLNLQELAIAPLIATLAHLLQLNIFQPSGATSLQGSDAHHATLGIYAGVLQLIDRRLNTTQLIRDLLARMTYDGTYVSSLKVLTGDLIGLCGQQLAVNPAILDETQNRVLVDAAKVLARLFDVNRDLSAKDRLPVHAFYCTVLDLSPFLEHFVHRASLCTTKEPVSSLAQFNACQYPILLSLGAKARIVQLENELRFSLASRQSSTDPVTFTAAPGSLGRLTLYPNCIKLTVQRAQCREQSQTLFLQLLEHCEAESSYDDLAVPLRVEFEGELAVDGGGPTREWFATVLSAHRPSSLASHGWFVQSGSSQAVDEARFLGLMLGLAALHSAKVALGFEISQLAFKLATSASLDTVRLTCADLETIDAPLAKALQTVLDWTSDGTIPDAEQHFDSTFSLTWSTQVQDVTGGTQTIDLIAGGRHRPVKLADRHDFVSKLVWRVLIGSVQDQAAAFCAGWQAIIPLFDHQARFESCTDVISRGGLAMSLLDVSEIAQSTCSVPAERGSAVHVFQPLDMSDLENATELFLGPQPVSDYSNIVASFWKFWAELAPVEQRKLLAFITGSQDMPLTGARGIGLRIHLVQSQNLEIACHQEEGSWPIPWSSTCTSTLFLPAYPCSELMEKKLLVAIEHYRGFGLR